MKKLNKSSIKEEGFTLIEIVIVVFIIGVLAAVLLPAIFQSRNQGQFGASETQINTSFPRAIAGMLIYQPSCLNQTKAVLIATGGLKSTNPFGQLWTVSATTTNTLTVTYPFDSAANATLMGTRLGASQSLNSATPTGVNLAIVYACQ